MKPILVHVHIYYVDQIDFILKHLKNITVPYDLYITMISENPDVVNKIMQFNPNAHIKIVENRGYDVWPFIDVINHLNLDDYSYIIKLHTKQKLNNSVRLVVRNNNKEMVVYGDKWRKILYSILSSSKMFNYILKYFDQNPNVGMIASKYITHNKPYEFNVVKKLATEKYKNYVFEPTDYYFVAGTMFICRANIFQHIQKMNIGIDLFDKPTKSHTAQFAHVMERVFGQVVYHAGYVISDTSNPPLVRTNFHPIMFIKWVISKITRFFFRIQDNKIKIFKIPIYKIKNTQQDISCLGAQIKDK